MRDAAELLFDPLSGLFYHALSSRSRRRGCSVSPLARLFSSVLCAVLCLRLVMFLVCDVRVMLVEPPLANSSRWETAHCSSSAVKSLVIAVTLTHL